MEKLVDPGASRVPPHLLMLLVAMVTVFNMSTPAHLQMIAILMLQRRLLLSMTITTAAASTPSPHIVIQPRRHRHRRPTTPGLPRRHRVDLYELVASRRMQVDALVSGRHLRGAERRRAAQRRRHHQRGAAPVPHRHVTADASRRAVVVTVAVASSHRALPGVAFGFC